jgi:Ca2+-binding EF-hand superfamily protein
MGCSTSRTYAINLSPEALEAATSTFAVIDANHSDTIDKQETARWWEHKYATVNTKAMFEAVDTDNDGLIDLKEWIAYWTQVKALGQTDAEIIEELET